MLLGVMVLLIPFTSVRAVDSPVKTYTLVDLKQAVSNSPKCDAFYESLKPLTQAPFSLQFNEPSETGERTVQHLGGQLVNHTHTTMKQSVNGNLVHRVGMGTFELNGEKIDYVMEIGADLDNPDHQYLYPTILASDNARCYCTALVKPDEATVTAFKKSIQSGAVAQNTDLHQA